MKMYVAGQWIDKDQKIEVRNSYDNSVIDTVPRADRGDIERALQSAERGARAMAKLTSYERWKILHRAADLLAERAEERGTLISKEEGKIIAEGRAEALRAVDTIMESAEEAKRVHGETVALDAASHGKGKFGVTIRVPCGVVVAISPFNFPLNLVCHKVGPAIAGGNAVIVKPATDTPLSALRLTEILLEAGLPPEGINTLTGSGGGGGGPLVADRLAPKVAALKVGNQLDPTVHVGPMIREKEAVRVDEWVKEAVASGARIVTGGTRQNAMYAPTVVADVKPEMRISCDELFGPAVAVTPFTDIDEAIALANDTNYGLAAGIFTENLEWAWKFAREVQSGNLHINWGPQWRADRMPYGGLKESGFGKEGPAYAIEEMTGLKMVVFHLSS